MNTLRAVTGVKPRFKIWIITQIAQMIPPVTWAPCVPRRTKNPDKKALLQLIMFMHLKEGEGRVQIRKHLFELLRLHQYT